MKLSHYIEAVDMKIAEVKEDLRLLKESIGPDGITLKAGTVVTQRCIRNAQLNDLSLIKHLMKDMKTELPEKLQDIFDAKVKLRKTK